MDLAKLPLPRQFPSDYKVGFTRPLSTSLKYPPVSLGRRHQRLALRNGQRTGLFTIHVLASLHRQNRRRSMPAVAGGDEHGINFRVFT